MLGNVAPLAFILTPVLPLTTKLWTGVAVPIPTLPLPDTNKAEGADGDDTCNKLALFEPVIKALSNMVGENISIFINRILRF
jgi:hypothetical protein